MTPQELNPIAKRGEKHLRSKHVLASPDVIYTPESLVMPPAPVAPLTVALPAVQEPNLPLFAQNDAQDFRTRWEKIQIGFVDEPRKAVEQADDLVASAIKQLEALFASERQKLEAEWDKNDSTSTEDLRLALRRYRSFFNRLLAV